MSKCDGCEWKGNKNVCGQCNDQVADKIAHVEPTTCDEPLAEEKGERPHPQYSVHVHSRTNRLADPDGRSIKAALDGCIKGGILFDDSPEFIKEVTQSQEKVKGGEETIITFKFG